MRLNISHRPRTAFRRPRAVGRLTALLNGHTLPLKVINNNDQYDIREYAAIVRIVEVGVPGRVMMKSLKKFSDNLQLQRILV